MQTMLFRAFYLSLFTLTFSMNSYAYESETDHYGYFTPSFKPTVQLKVKNETRIEKFNLALDTIGIPREPTPDFSHFVHAGEVNQVEVEKNLQFIDPEKGLSRYLSFAKGSVQLFRDFFKSMISLNYLEYQQELSQNNPSHDSEQLIQRLKTISNQTKSGQSLPLNGLKVLIDPGHMGGEHWDELTGKFVVNPETCDKDSSGNIKFETCTEKVSEGELNLWTSLLVAKKLEALGANVLLTRENLGPVSTENPDRLNVTPYRNTYFYNSMDDWMTPYLNLSSEILRKTIRSKPEVKLAFSTAQKKQFFISNADLEARTKMIDAFQPDITLDIHFDAVKTTELQNSYQFLEAFVPGSFGLKETGSRKSKALALKHALEVRRWNESVELADQVTQSMSTSLKIPRLTDATYYSSIHVRDGVYARNLYITRNVVSGLVIYLECLHYDHISEHRNLSILDRTDQYHDQLFHYPKRLSTIANSIENGFLNYFKNSF